MKPPAVPQAQTGQFLSTGTVQVHTRTYVHSVICWFLFSKYIAQITQDKWALCKCEQFAQVTQDKWVTVSQSVRCLMTKEQPWAIPSGRSAQKSEWTNHSFFLANCSFFLLLTKNERLAKKIVFLVRLVFLKSKRFAHSSEQCEKIAQVAH